MKIINKKKFVRTISIIIVLIVLLITIIIILPEKVEYTKTYKTIRILEKETLWDIAEEYKKPNQDIREYIYMIKELNNMDNATIYEGQELTIIIYEEVK